ncbi:MAG: ACP S-malonyltransferase [Candidatus Schekmanbacteria bacterium]|nr:ACP S-malonyltransferase [Candidatus Schekmanbacteria bacterium]
MGRDLAAEYPEARSAFEQAATALAQPGLVELCFSGPDSDLKLTVNTQPALLAASAAALAALRRAVERCGGALCPDFMAGHSLGEYSALVAAGSLGLADAVRLVRQRAELMQAAVPAGEGAMAALVGVRRDVAAQLAAETSAALTNQAVDIAGFNAPGQIVISGNCEAVRHVCTRVKEQKLGRAVEIPVSAPFHCRLMEPAAAQLAEVLEHVAIQPPTCPIISNVTALPTSDTTAIRRLLREQVTHPVLWEDTVVTLLSAGVETFVEVGPRTVLSDLVRRCVREAPMLDAGRRAAIRILDTRDRESLERSAVALAVGGGVAAG